MIITIQYSISLGLVFWNQLKSPMIVSDQYQHSKSKDWINWKLSKSAMESIEIGDYSFSDFGGEFELKNLTQLQSIQIGIIGSTSYNFYSSSFVIRGIELILNITMNRSSIITIHYIG